MATATETQVKDPVCGMEISPAQAASRTDFEGATFYFCSDSCRVATAQKALAHLGKDKIVFREITDSFIVKDQI